MKKKEIFEEYKKKLKKWREEEQPASDLREVTFNDALVIMLKLHPTDRKESKKISKQILEYLAENEIVTTDEIVKALGISKPTFYNRLQFLRSMGLVRRERRIYYLATPRLYDFIKNHIRRFE